MSLLRILRWVAGLDRNLRMNAFGDGECRNCPVAFGIPD